MEEMESLNCAQYAYEKKQEGSLAVMKTVLIFIYIAFTLGFFLFCFITRIIPLFAVCPIFLWMLVFFTWPMVKFDIVYTFEHGNLTFYKEYRWLKGKKRKELLKMRIQEAERIAPYTGEKLEGKICDYASSSSASSLVFVTGKNTDGQMVSVIFDSIERVNKLLCSFAKDASKELRSYVYGSKS